MKLIDPKERCPQDGSIVLAVNSDKRRGFVGCMIYKNNKWFMAPFEDGDMEMSHNDFYWIEQ